MARVLYVWEQGGQLSHLNNIDAVARQTAGAGHLQAVALRELQRAHQCFAGLRLQYYQAPFKQGPPPRELAHYKCYAHMLWGTGWADAGELLVLLSAWVGLFDAFRPDLVVFEHSPTALLASRSFTFQRVLLGPGFMIPPLERPLGVFPDVDRSEAVLRTIDADEQAVLGVANEASRALGIEPLASMASIYEPANASFLLTFPELDPFGERPDAEYLGVLVPTAKPVPEWPAGRRRVFAYFGACAGAPALLSALRKQGAATLVHAPQLPQQLRREAAGPTLRFVDGMVDLERVSTECDLVVSHGAHGCVARSLLGGVPQLMLPRFKEQLFTAMRVQDLGAGLLCAHDQGAYDEPVARLLDDPAFTEAARRFARRHRGFDPRRSQETIAACLAALL